MPYEVEILHDGSVPVGERYGLSEIQDKHAALAVVRELIGTTSLLAPDTLDLEEMREDLEGAGISVVRAQRIPHPDQLELPIV